MNGQDQEVIARIEELAHEEHALFELEARGEASRSERERLMEIQAQLDRSYDLLRQRRARRAAGLDPDEAVEREPAGSQDEATAVEGSVG
jgi:hypothetical protein